MNNKLIIDTTDSQKTAISWQGKRYSAPNKRFASQVLLSLIDEAIGGRDNLPSIQSIEVKPGPGSFTGLRVGFSVAQLLGWQLACPVNGQTISSQNIALPDYE